MKNEPAVNNLMLFAITFVIIATIVSLGANLLADVKSSADDNSAFYGNESLTWAGNNTAISLAQNNIVTGSQKLYNNGSFVNQGNNYTITSSSITIINTSSTVDWVTTKINLSYDYYYGSYQRNITNYGLISQNTFGKWLPTLALILIIVIIIGLLLTFVMKRFE